ncbi:hypothetical protein AAHA92_00061 [Salvia divinorum]|uniref:DDE Tnp4 domain-containing protein n=1 Tax=Salvia divinorum TaxID=28513 RepID=A0ABD1IIA2_SALDI
MTNQLTQNKVSRRRKELSNFMLVLEEIIRSHQLNMLLIRMLLSMIKSKKSKKTKRFWRNRWKWFKGCLGALDGTYINVRVPTSDAPRYRNRKGQITTNTLAVCDRRLRFVYVLPGWEGSAGDSRILRDALSRPLGLKVPRGQYYLCDNGYANSEGFITPYK